KPTDWIFKRYEEDLYGPGVKDKVFINEKIPGIPGVGSGGSLKNLAKAPSNNILAHLGSAMTFEMWSHDQVKMPIARSAKDKKAAFQRFMSTMVADGWRLDMKGIKSALGMAKALGIKGTMFDLLPFPPAVA